MKFKFPSVPIIATAIAIVAIFGIDFGTNCLAANENGGSEFERAGLTPEWFTQLEVAAGVKIVNMQIQVNEDKSTRYYLIEYGGTVERVSQFDFNAFGEEYGIEGAEEHANVRREVILAELAAQHRNIPVTIRGITLPQTTIYTATSNGSVTAIDADTGTTRWKTKVGRPNFITSGVGAGKDFVAVANGSSVYCMSADEGRVLWSRVCRRAPSAPPSVNHDSVFVPLIDGRLESFLTEDGGGLPRSYTSFGQSIAKPLVTDSTVSWATADGFFAAAPFGAKSIGFRLDSGSKMAAGGAAGVKKLFVNTTEGSIFALDERTGLVLWEYSTGDRLTDTPIVRDGVVYTVSANQKLYKIDVAQGRPSPGWEEPLEGYSKFVGISRQRIYLLNGIGRLVAIDKNTGKPEANLGGGEITYVLPNYQTDRLYIGTDKGLLRCVREAANVYPVYHTANGELMIGDANKKQDAKEATEKPAEESQPAGDPFTNNDPFAVQNSDDKKPTDADDDPFGGGSDADDDPFGGGGDTDVDDPFGGGGDTDDTDDGDDDDPFGGGGDTEDDDPFGGGSSGGDADPFGRP